VSGLRLIESNKLEVLSEALAATLSRPLSSPLTPEIIVVQSRGMQRWLSMELARMHGVCANVRWPFPNAFVLDMFSRVLPGFAQPGIFERDALTLRIMDCLPGLLTNTDFSRVRVYLENDMDSLKLYQFSSMMAGIYDQYLVFRPETVLGWEEGRAADGFPEKWQAELWRRVVEGAQPNHRARLRRLFLRGLQDADVCRLPERVSVFGISYLPSFFLEVLKGLSEKMDVRLFCLNPCREYWADILPERRIVRMAAQEGQHAESINEVLAINGRLGRNFLDMVLDLDPDIHDLFIGGKPQCMLERVQDDILNLCPPGQDGVHEAGEEDRSIQVHSCHSPMREIEVLLDSLLDLFGKESSLEPKDVLVMAPDIEDYAPFIHAVFDLDKNDVRRIPYSISDRSFRRSSKLADALMAVIDLAGRRFEASAVLDLLDMEALRRRWGMDEEDLRKVHAWVAGANIRWGRDGLHKEELGLPGFVENTWEFGLRRLLLGYAMEPGGGLFEGIAPHAEVDPADAVLLGRFADFVEGLFATVDALSQERTCSQWSGVLLEIIDGMFGVDEDGVQELLRLKAAVKGLERAASDAGFAGQLGMDVVRAHLGRALSSASEGAGFLERGVTFCSMLPMRSIPFKVVCLMGMNHDAFPRKDISSGIDLMAMHPRKGDRSRRDDDLYLFLEALLSARRVLWISHVGQGIQDNAPKPPSVAVSGLLEYLDRGFTMKGEPAGKSVVTKHCLQAFNPKYFLSGTGLFSYSTHNAAAARALMAGAAPAKASAALPEPGREWRELDAERLIEFFRGPARFFLRHRLGVTLPREVEEPADREPFELARLERYVLQQRLLAERLAGKAEALELARHRAEGVLPHGLPGELALKGLSAEIDAFWPLITRAMEGRAMLSADVDVRVNGFTVTGVVKRLEGAGFLSFRYAALAPNDFVRAWVSMLLLQVMNPGLQVTARHIHSEGEVRLKPPADPLAELGRLLDVYWQGLSRALHFFPRSAYAYMAEMMKSGDAHRAMAKARIKWGGGHQAGAEVEDAAAQLCFPDADPLDGEFTDLAQCVFGPLLASIKEE